MTGLRAQVQQEDLGVGCIMWTDSASPRVAFGDHAEQETVNSTSEPQEARVGPCAKAEQGTIPGENEEAFFCTGPFPSGDSSQNKESD